VERVDDLVRLNSSKLDYQQASALRALCEQKIGEFLEGRGVSPWDYRLLETDPVPTSLRYEVLRRAKGTCQLCHTSELPTAR